MVQYIVFEARREEVTNYGISVVDNGVQIDRVEDVVTDQGEALYLAGMLQQNGVAGDQFRDIVEDFIAK